MNNMLQKSVKSGLKEFSQKRDCKENANKKRVSE